MELTSHIVTTAPLPAATVVLLRDGTGGMEVFLMKRHSKSDVLGGAYVFPGGKVDAADAHAGLAAQLDQPADALHAALAEPGIDSATASGLYVAAIREVFEEAGVLFAHRSDGQPLDLAQATALQRAGQDFSAVLAQSGLQLLTSALVPWTRWITPRMPSHAMGKRFDTRFFVAAVPHQQVAQHDNYETTESLWLSPREALARYWQQTLPMAPPQLMTLAHLARHTTVAEVLQAGRDRTPPTIEPHPFDEDGQRIICYPGDPSHAVPVRALPGPSRLVYRNKRFEPLTGFDAWFA
jgi:8-oxo-dGTP pyrophosphatase MutT (NUDIX family)